MFRTTRSLFLIPLGLLAVALSGTLPLRAAPQDALAQLAGPLTHHVLVPLAMKGAEPVGAPGGVANGSFESGVTNWSIFSTFGRTVIRTTFVGSVKPHTGGYAAWLGGLRGETTAIQQQISVSAATPYLSYWHWIGSSDYCGYDKAYIRVNGATVNSHNLCATTNTGGWVKRSVNLSAFAGQSVTLQIRVSTDTSLNSNLFVDDIGLQAAPALMEAEALSPDLERADVPAADLKPAEPPVGQALPEASPDGAEPLIMDAPASDVKPVESIDIHAPALEDSLDTSGE